MATPTSPLHYRIRFLAPAFLGDANQAGRWRTPPIKALLRQFWRMAWAEDHGFSGDVNRMRDAEGQLFGSASDEEHTRRSLVRLRLAHWDAGRLASWQPLPKVGDKHPVGADIYLGYGPIKPGAVLKKAPAIGAGESNELSIGFDPRDPGTLEHESGRLRRALQLAATYGTLGGRSRNGWGSFALDGVGTCAPPLREWRAALKLDWPHAVGKDSDGALVWQTEPHSDWRAAMVDLARVRLRVRHEFPLKGPGGSVPGDRHWLAYPVTKGEVPAWKREGASGRIPNTLRFRLREHPGGICGVVFHVPCSPPAIYRPDFAVLERVWGQVHAWLDKHLPRIEG